MFAKIKGVDEMVTLGGRIIRWGVNIIRTKSTLLGKASTNSGEVVNCSQTGQSTKSVRVGKFYMENFRFSIFHFPFKLYFVCLKSIGIYNIYIKYTYYIWIYLVTISYRTYLHRKKNRLKWKLEIWKNGKSDTMSRKSFGEKTDFWRKIWRIACFLLPLPLHWMQWRVLTQEVAHIGARSAGNRPDRWHISRLKQASKNEVTAINV